MHECLERSRIDCQRAAQQLNCPIRVAALVLDDAAEEERVEMLRRHFEHRAAQTRGLRQVAATLRGRGPLDRFLQ